MLLQANIIATLKKRIFKLETQNNDMANLIPLLIDSLDVSQHELACMQDVMNARMVDADRLRKQVSTYRKLFSKYYGRYQDLCRFVEQMINAVDLEQANRQAEIRILTNAFRTQQLEIYALKNKLGTLESKQAA